MIAGFNLLCMGDDRGYSFISSRHGNTLADKLMRHVMGHCDPLYWEYDFLDRASDERQYCAPGIDLPLVAVMRGGFDMFPEYHTSDDNLSLISERGLSRITGADAAMQSRSWRTTCAIRRCSWGAPARAPRALFHFGDR